MSEVDVFSDKNKVVPESNFFKFEKVGDSVSGYLVSVRLQEGKGAYGPQKIFLLEQSDGEEVSVGIAMSKVGVINVMRNAKVGQLIGFKFVKTLAPKTPGFQPTKCIDVFLTDEFKETKDKVFDREPENQMVGGEGQDTGTSEEKTDGHPTSWDN